MQKGTLGGSIEFTIASVFIVVRCFFGLYFSVPPPPPIYIRHSLSEKCFSLSSSKERFLLLTVSSHTVHPAPPHRDPHSPMLTYMPMCITAFLLRCRPSEILRCRKTTSMMQTFSFHSG